MTNSTNPSVVPAVDQTPAPPPVYYPKDKNGKPESQAEKNMEQVADKAAQKAAKTEQQFDRDNSKPFSK